MSMSNVAGSVKGVHPSGLGNKAQHRVSQGYHGVPKQVKILTPAYSVKEMT